MNLDKKQYRRYAKGHAPRSPVLKNGLAAFLSGGSICLLAEGLTRLYLLIPLADMDRALASTLTSCTLILFAVSLTAAGVFDRVARITGAGTLVPITGFANAVASSAIDSRAEGFILGVGAKIFTVAGPVLLYGTLSGVLYGVIYYTVTLLLS